MDTREQRGTISVSTPRASYPSADLVAVFLTYDHSSLPQWSNPSMGRRANRSMRGPGETSRTIW